MTRDWIWRVAERTLGMGARVHPVSRMSGAVLLAVMASAGLAHGQGTATLQGTVTDATQGVLPGATITVTATATGMQRVVVTDSIG